MSRLLAAVRAFLNRCHGCGHSTPTADCSCPDGRCYCANCGTAGGNCDC